VSGAANKYRFVLNGRWIPEKAEAGQAYLSLKYWLTDDFGLGCDYRPLVDQVRLMATYRIISEDPSGWRPAVIAGTSADDFSDKGVEVNSRSYFVTVSKALQDLEFWGITPAPYAGAVWIEELDKVRPLVGISLKHKEASLMYQYSGTDSHLTLSRSLNANVSVSAVYWGMKYPGLAMRFRF
jgi:hypothetical protein